jgi:PAS domain S-box-containing protein
MKRKILVVDDDRDVRETIEAALQLENYSVRSAASGERAISMLEADLFDLVITDIRMPGTDGVTVLRRTKEIDDSIEVIILTGYASIENAIETLRNDGAYDYLTKPLESVDGLLLSVAQALEHRALRNMNCALTSELKRQNKELQRVQGALLESEERFRTIASITSDYFYSLSVTPDPPFEVAWIDGAFEKITGYRTAEIGSDEDWSRIVHADDHGVLAEGMQRLLANERNVAEYRILARDGAERWMRDYSHPVWDPQKNRVVTVLGAVRDITESKQAATILEQTRKRYELAANAGQVSVWDWNIDANVLFIDPGLKRMLGYDTHELENGVEDWLQFVHPEDVPKILDIAQQHTDCQSRTYELSHRMIHKDGRTLWFLARGTVMANEGGEVCRMIGTHTNITERIQTEKALQESEARYRSFMNQFNGIVFRCSLTEGVEFVNGAVEAITGYTGTDFVERRISLNQIVHSEDAALIDETTRKLKTVPDYATTREYRIVRKDGHVRWLKEYIQNVCDETGSPATIQAIIYDHTERKAIEEKLQEDQIFKAIASLAGGVAHEFNNALVGITGNLELMVMEMADATPYAAYVSSIKSAAQRMSALTGQLLAYARGGKYQARELRLDEFLRDALPLTLHAINPAVRIETDVPSETAVIKGDPIQLQMVLSAILANASEAMDGRGRIRLSMRRKMIDAQSMNAPKQLAHGPYVCLRFQDEGCGMDADTLARICEPFFTTKLPGRGLSMAAVYGIVKNHGGGITIDSERSKGTTVSVYLPVIETTASAVVEENAATAIMHGSGTILIVDDESIVLDVGQAILKKLGYTVLTCANGKEAIRLFQSGRPDIDLVLLDIKLPDMNGAEVLSAIKQQCPDMKVIICSGYALVGPDQQNLLATGADDFIQKPFTIAELSTKTSKLLAD